jgi:heme/copper-type cytochrome/quinol oxidase subunit 4
MAAENDNFSAGIRRLAKKCNAFLNEGWLVIFFIQIIVFLILVDYFLTFGRDNKWRYNMSACIKSIFITVMQFKGLSN